VEEARRISRGHFAARIGIGDSAPWHVTPDGDRTLRVPDGDEKLGNPRYNEGLRLRAANEVASPSRPFSFASSLPCSDGFPSRSP
jgi:hypothetical protein